MDSDVEFTRPSRTLRLRANQPPTNEPRRHPKVGGTTVLKNTADIEPSMTTNVITFFTISSVNQPERFNVTKVIVDPDIPHNWASVIVSKTRFKTVTAPDGSISTEEDSIAPPMEISQKLLDDSIIKVEEEMKKLTKEKQFGSDQYIQKQLLRERMLDTYRHASAAS